VIDATGSMGSYIADAKKTVEEIINSTEKSLMTDYPETYKTLLSFGIVAYRDHPPQDNSFVTKKQDFSNSETAKAFLSVLSAEGGGDFPEAAMDGMYVAANELKWREKN